MNMDSIQGDRIRYHGIKQATCLQSDVQCSEAGYLDVQEGSIVAIINIDGGSPVLLMLTAIAVDESCFSLTTLDLPEAVQQSP